MPGGQPSTMQPIAGPWLSPKVVTVNALPKLLPDIILRSELALVAIKFVPGQQKYALTAEIKLQPGKFDLREVLLEGPLTISHLNDEDTVIGEKTACIMQDRYH